MDENNLGNQNQPQNTEQNNNQSMFDKMKQNNPFIKTGPETYQNVQTQSVVMSTREEADEQLAAIAAHNAEILRQQKLAEEAAKAKRTGAYIGIGVFFAIILVVAGWLIVNAIIAGQKSIQPGSEIVNDGPTKYGRVEGYKCKTEKCEKMADITKKDILVRDGKQYFMFNTETKDTSLTTIPEEEYHAITPFVWGGKNFAVLDPESAQSGLFSITDNRQVADFAYDSFFMDINSDEYKDMTWVDSKYIVAKSAGSLRLVQINNGTELVRASKRVFVHDDYFFGYENDGSVHIYSSGKQFLVVPATTTIFTNGKQAVVVDNANGFRIFEHSGEETTDENIVNYISSIENEALISTLTKNPKYFKIPASK